MENSIISRLDSIISLSSIENGESHTHNVLTILTQINDLSRSIKLSAENMELTLTNQSQALKECKETILRLRSDYWSIVNQLSQLQMEKVSMEMSQGDKE